MKPRIDTLYIYESSRSAVFATRFAKMNVRAQDDFRFLRGNVPDIAPVVYRYARTVNINGIDRTFLMVTLDSSKKKVAAFFTRSLKEIAADPKLVKQFNKARSIPFQTAITYGN